MEGEGRGIGKGGNREKGREEAQEAGEKGVARTKGWGAKGREET